MPSRLQRVAELFGFAREAQSAGVTPPSRPPAPRGYASTDAALTLSSVYRFIGIHATSVMQLTLAVERNGVAMSYTPALVAKPDLDENLSAFLEYATVSLYIDGNAYWHLIRSPFSGEVIDIKPINPNEVHPYKDPKTGEKLYQWKGKRHTTREIKHLRLLTIPGREKGLGPIQAAQAEIAGAIDARDYGALWFQESGIPDGVLTTDLELGAGEAERYKNLWEGRNADGTEKDETTPGAKSRLRVLGKGLSYSPLLLKPTDVQFLESQQFNTTQLARLFGVPSSLALAAVEGNSQTYANVEQEWIAYVRFSLMLALRTIEEAFTDLLPRGQKARFVLEALLRADTKTRYEGHAIALDRWMTVDEIRDIENLPPLTDAQREQLAAATPAPVPQKESAK